MTFDQLELIALLYYQAEIVISKKEKESIDKSEILELLWQSRIKGKKIQKANLKEMQNNKW
jgi:hypothetical protein